MLPLAAKQAPAEANNLASQVTLKAGGDPPPACYFQADPSFVIYTKGKLQCRMTSSFAMPGCTGAPDLSISLSRMASSLALRRTLLRARRAKLTLPVEWSLLPLSM